MNASRTPAVLVLATCLGAPCARADDAPPRPRSFEVSLGAAVIGGRDVGTKAATLTGNDPGGPGYTLFNTRTRIGRGTGFEIRAGYSLTRLVSLEAAFSRVPQTVTTRITGDVEGAPDQMLTARFMTYAVGGGVLIHVRALTFAGGRGLPFVAGGAGYVRQLDESGLLLGTGSSVDGGGGVKYALLRRAGGLVRTLGVRGETSVVSRSGQFDPAAAAGRRTSWRVVVALLLGL